MTVKELTPKQVEVLEAIRREGYAFYMHDMGRFGSANWSLGTIGKCTKQVEALIKKGYLRKERINLYGEAKAYIVDGK